MGLVCFFALGGRPLRLGFSPWAGASLLLGRLPRRGGSAASWGFSHSCPPSLTGSVCSCPAPARTDDRSIALFSGGGGTLHAGDPPLGLRLRGGRVRDRHAGKFGGVRDRLAHFKKGGPPLMLQNELFLHGQHLQPRWGGDTRRSGAGGSGLCSSGAGGVFFSSAIRLISLLFQIRTGPKP